MTASKNSGCHYAYGCRTIKAVIVAFLTRVRITRAIYMGTAKLNLSMQYVLGSAGAMEIMRLAKFLYLADYVYAKTFGNKHGFIDEHQRYKYGPVPAEFYKVYNTLLDTGIISRTGNIIALEVAAPGINTQLSEEELACLDKVIEEFEGKPLQTVKRTAYATEPMKHIQEEEKRLGAGIFEFRKMDFSDVEVHPLMKPVDDDLSFMDSAEFKENLS